MRALLSCLFNIRRIVTLIVALASLATIAAAQDPADYLYQTGRPNFSPIQSFPGGSTVNISNGNLHIEIPLGTFSQRGFPQITEKLVYDSRIWEGTASMAWNTQLDELFNLGWRLVGEAKLVQLIGTSASPTATCGGVNYSLTQGEYLWTGLDGNPHIFHLAGTPNCITGGAGGAELDALAADGSGFHLFNSGVQMTKIYARDGTLVYADPPIQSSPCQSPCTFTLNDVNGNFLNWYFPNYKGYSTSTLTDTLDRTPFAATYNSGTITIQVLNSQGTTGSVVIQTANSGLLYPNAFGQPGTYPGSVVQSIALADGSQYSFTYDCFNTSGSPAACSNTGTPSCGASGACSDYGDMTSMTLPTGGTVNFSYTIFKDTNSDINRWISAVSYGGGQWIYSPALNCGTNCQTVTVTRPSGAQEVYTFNFVGLGSGLAAQLKQAQYYNGSVGGNPSLTLQNTYGTSSTWCAALAPTNTSVTVPSPAGNLVAQTQYVYDSYLNCTTGKLLSKSEYGFGIGSPGPLLRKTVQTYLDDVNASYRSVSSILYSPYGPDVTAVNIMDRVVDMQVQDGFGNIKAETKTSYDSTTLSSVTGIQNHDDTNFGSGYTTRGNATQVQGLVSGLTFINTGTLTYDTTGQVTQVQDGNGNATSISYVDNFYSDSSPASNPPSHFTPTHPTNAVPTAITLPIIGNSTLGYYYGSGKTAVSIDANGADSYLHFLDPLDRKTHTFLPFTNGNRGWSLTTYSGGGVQTDSYSTINDAAPSTSCSSCVHNIQNLDSFARTIQNTLQSDPDGPTLTAITYDASGRTHAASNPYRAPSDPTYGLTTYNFDVLGRTTLISEADGSSMNMYYGADVSGAGGASSQLCSPSTYGYGYPVLLIDEAGKKKQTWSDALGHTIEADEADSSGALTIATCYTYDVLDNLTGVAQQGGTTDSTQWRNRTFSYDGLSRLVSATEPESGTATYTYDNNGNLLTKTSPVSIAATPGTGTATASGNEQYIGSPATSGTGSVTFSGSLQSTQVQTQAATPGTGTVTIGGFEQFKYVPPPGCHAKSCATLVYDSGTVYITVNGHSDVAYYGQGSTSGSIASALTNVINSDSGSSVSASVSGSVITLTAKVAGSSSNYSLSTSVSYDSTDFTRPSFTATPSGSALTGGQDATYTTVYDSGTCTISVNSYGDSQSWSGSSTTASSIASAITSVINGDGNAFVTAALSGTTVNLTARATGASTNYSLSSSCSYDTSHFSSPSFTTSNSGSTLTGGTNQGQSTIYDSGSVSITINGTPYPVSYGQGSSLSSVASALASAISAGSLANASASSSGANMLITITSKATGSGTNYPISCATASCSSSNDPSQFPSPSFSVSLTASALTGGKDGANQATISYCYDALNRLTAKTYTYPPNTPPTCSGTPPSFSSPVATYLYDQTSFNGLTITNGLGRRTGMTDAGGSEAWSYDAQGNVVAEQRTTNGITKLTSYTYNLDGSLASITYPSGRTVTYTTYGAGRPVSAVDTANSINYAVSAHYSPVGDLASIQNGSNVVSSYIFNNRLQPCWFYTTTGTALAWNSTNCAATTTAASVLDLKLNFNLGSGDNGSVTGITNNRDNTRSQNFTYDPMNRLATAQTQTTGVTIPNANCWGLSFGYDSWGNLLTSNVNGPAGCSEPLPMSVSVNASNQINGYCYGAGGSLLDEGGCPSGAHAYNYDAENRLTSAANVSYTYDGDGQRVQKSNGKLYWYGSGSVPLEETDLAGNTNNSSFFEYVFFGDGRIARRDYQNNVDYYFTDHLGTSRVVTNSSGTSLDDSDFYPFGGERPVTSSSGNAYKFTGYERDSESGLDYASARHFNSLLGRFMSPDPLTGSPENPQSWNAYSYVYNNPLNATDPSGMCSEDDWWSGCEWDTGWGSLDVWGWFGYWSPNTSVDTSGYEGWLNYSYGDPLAAGPTLQTGGPISFGSTNLYPNDNSIASHIFNDCQECSGTFTGATNLVNIGAGYTAAGIGLVVGAPAIAAAPGAATTAWGAARGAARLLGARALGWYYGTFGAGTGVVLGKWDVLTNYVQAAKSIGANALNSPRAYDFFNEAGEWWTLNKAFIDASIARGQQFFMSSPVLGATGNYAQELEYLISRGIGPQAWQMVWLPY